MKDVISFAMFMALLPIFVAAIGVRIVVGIALRGWDIGGDMFEWLF